MPSLIKYVWYADALAAMSPVDFLALLFGYAISGERTLAAFFARATPFGAAFLALFGRANLPHRATLSRFLASVDAPCLEAFRTLFEQNSFVQQWTEDSLGGIWDRQGYRYKEALSCFHNDRLTLLAAHPLSRLLRGARQQ